MINGTRTSFESPAVSQKLVGIAYHIAHWHLTKFYFDYAEDSK